MPKFEYAGPCPVQDENGVLVHPGDVLELDEVPEWGPWRALDEPEKPSAPPPARTPTPAPAVPPAATTATPAATPAPAAETGKQA